MASSSSPVAAWKTCLEHLNQLLACPATSSVTSSTGTLLQQVLEFTTTKSSPSNISSQAQWSQLVQEQVPKQVSTACAAAIRQGPRSVAAVAALALMRRLLGVALGHQQSQQASNSLWQQIQQLGVLSQLPGVLAAVAVELVGNQVPESDAAGSSSSGSSSDTRSMQDRPILHTHAGDMLVLLESVLEVAPEGERRLALALALAPSAMKLMTAFVQHTDMLNRQQQLPDSDLVLLGGLSRVCCSSMLAMTKVLYESGGTDGSAAWFERRDAAGLLACEHFMPCLLTMGAVGAFAATGDWQPASQQRAAQRGSRSRSTSSATKQQDTALVAQQQVAANLGVVTLGHERLFEAVGLSSPTLLLFAGILRLHAPQRTPTQHAAWMVNLAILLSTQAQDLLQPAGAQQLQPLQMLVPSLWMFWGSQIVAARDPQQLCLKDGVMPSLRRVAIISYGAIGQWSEVEEKAQQAAATEANLLSKIEEGGTGVDQLLHKGLAAPTRLDPELLDELLPQVLSCLQFFLVSQEGRQHVIGITALVSMLCILLKHSGLPADTTTRTAAAGIAASTSGRQAIERPEVAAWDVPQVVQDSLPAILKLLHLAVRFFATTPASASHMQGPYSDLSDVLSSIALLAYSLSSSAGHDSSPLLQRLFSFLASVIKFSRVYRFVEHADRCRMRAAGACLSVLNSSLSASNCARTAGVRDPGGSSSSRPVGACSSRNISHVLPCLALWGRCFLAAAEQVHTQDANLSPSLCAELYLPRLTGDPLKTWLAADGVAERLAAAGYQPQDMLQALQQYQDALEDSDTVGGSHPLAPLKQEMTAFGQLFSSVAVPKMICNYPGCSNVAGQSESGIVSGRSCICSGCRTARYCSKVCQRSHWQAHKPVCKTLAAAAAAAPAGTSAATTSS